MRLGQRRHMFQVLSDKTSETINGADAHFVGTWEHPNPNLQLLHEFVSGTQAKSLLKDLLPVASTDLKDGSQATQRNQVKQRLRQQKAHGASSPTTSRLKPSMEQTPTS